MAKQGFSYYKAETDRFQDIKIKRLKKKYHCTGYAVYQYVLNEIYRVRGYFLQFTEDHLFDVSEYWDIEEKQVTDIIGYCAEIGLFSAQLWQEQGVLTARSIQARYIDICKVCKKAPVIEEVFRLVPVEQAAPAVPPLPQLFPEDERAPMRIVPKPAAVVPGAPAAPPVEETKVEGIAAKVLAELEAREKEAVSEGFAKVPEDSGNFSEESDKSIKSYTSETKPSSDFPREEADKASPSENGNRLRLLMQSMGCIEQDWQELCRIEHIEAPDSPVWQLAEEVRQSGGRLSVNKYLMPSLRALVQAGRLHVRRETVERSAELRRMLAAIKVPSYDIGKILALAEGQERALYEAIEEVRRSKGKITMPSRYLLSRLKKAAPAKAS